MIVGENIDIALGSLWRNKLRSILTMLGIIIGVASVILLVSIGSGLQSYITKQFESLGANLIYIIPGEVSNGGPSARLTLTNRELRAIQRIGYPLKAATPVVRVPAKVKYQQAEANGIVIGLEHTGVQLLNFQPEKGTAINLGDVNKKTRVAFIGPNIAEKIFKKVTPVGKTILIQSTKYRVIGVFKSKGGGGGIGQSMDDAVIIPYTTAKQQFNQDRPTAIYAQAANKDVIDATKYKIEAVLAKTLEDDEFSVMGQEDLLGTINSILGVITAGLGGIAAISLLVGGIGIMNIMFVTVTERTKEIGLRKALGATPNDVLTQFLIEAVTVSVVGGSIGILFAMGVSVILNQYLSSEITPLAIIVAFGFSSMIGIIFGVVPAWKAAKMDPIKALRYE